MTKPIALIVDDDRDLMDLVALTFRVSRPEWEVVTECDPVRSLERFAASGAQAVISALRRPHLDGLSLIEQMKRLDDEASYMLVTGDADLSSALAGINDLGIDRYLLKPMPAEEYVQAVEQAMETRAGRSRLEASTCVFQMLELLGFGGVELDAAGRVVAISSLAQRIIADSDCLYQCPNGTLRPYGRREASRFSALYAQPSHGPDRQMGRSLLLSGTGREEPLAIYAFPMPGTGAAERRTLLVLVDPSRRTRLSIGQIAEMWSLSLAEARLVREVVKGQDIRDAALECGVSIDTARSYMKSVHRKMGVSRQGELVGRVLGLSL